MSSNSQGKEGDLWTSGQIAYGAVVIIANIKLLASFNIYTGWGEVIIFLSILTYFIVYYIESVIIELNYLYGTF
jgi:hypothetical protein